MDVLCTRNLNLIELFHRPPQTFSTIVKQIYFCMAVACGGATVHKKSVFYCIILRAPKTQSNTGDLVFEKILVLLLARVTSQLCLNETSGQWAEQGVVVQPGNIPAINRTLPFQWCILCEFHYMTNLPGIF